MSDDKRNSLNMVQRSKLITWLDAMRDHIAKNVRGLDAVAALMPEKCGFPVTRQNVSGTAKAIGVVIPKGRSAAKGRHPLREKIDSLGRRVDDLERRLSLVCRELGVADTPGHATGSPT